MNCDVCRDGCPAAQCAMHINKSEVHFVRLFVTCSDECNAEKMELDTNAYAKSEEKLRAKIELNE